MAEPAVTEDRQVAQPGKVDEEEEEEQEECAICYEAAGRATSLPCHCTLVYCNRCWDKALAQSINVCGQAKCPSCRGPVHVDYDAKAGGLVFSRAEEVPLLAPGSATTEEERRNQICRLVQMRQEVVDRLLAQARPEQVRLLEEFGAAHPALREASGTARGDAEEEGAGAAPSAGAEAADDGEARLQAIAAAEDSPSCVCGSSLVRVSGKERVLRIICQNYDLSPDSPQAEEMSNQFLDRGQAGVVCDLCDNNVESRSSVWTCQNGASTILHATAYDVCDTCFLHHVCGVADHRPPVPPPAPGQEDGEEPRGT